MLFAGFSIALLGSIFLIAFYGYHLGLGFPSGLLFCLILTELVVNGIAAYTLLRILVNLLPFSRGDASDITPIGLAFGVVLGVVQALLCFYEFGLLVVG